MELKPVAPTRKRLRNGTVFIAGAILLILSSLSFVLGQDKFGDVYAIKAGRIVTVTQGIIHDGTIIIRDGIIEAVGRDLVIPVEAEIIEEDTMVVYPGLIDAQTSLALVKTEKKEQPTQAGAQPSRTPAGPLPTMMSPEKLSVDMLNPKDPGIKKVRETGVTTVLTVPDQGIFIGQSALINLQGNKPEEMILKSPVAMHLGYSRQRGVYPSTLMAVIAFQHQSLLDAQYHKLQWDRYNKQKRGWRRPQPNKSLDALLPALEGRQPVIILANRENEIKRALELADEYNLDYILSGAVEGWRVVDMLKARMKPILVSLNFPKPESVTGYSFQLKIEGPSKEQPKKAKERPKSEEKKEAKPEEKKEEKDKEKEKEMAELYANAGVLHKAGIKFAFTSGSLKKPADFIKNAAKTIEYGLPKEEALKALTIYPAQIFGIADQIGSIEEGKIANLILTTRELFDEKTKVKYVFVDGKKIKIKEPEKKKAEGEPEVNVSGTWDVTITSPMGDVSVTITLTQSGSDVTGEFKSEVGTTSVYEGSVGGHEIQFSVKLPIGDQPMELVFNGTVEEETMEGTIDLGEMGSAEWEGTKTSGPGLRF
jgi:imidazolonepropionase-like amidohydrolase